MCRAERLSELLCKVLDEHRLEESPQVYPSRVLDVRSSFPPTGGNGQGLTGGSARHFEMPVPDFVPDSDHEERSERWQKVIDVLRRSQALGELRKRRAQQKTLGKRFQALSQQSS